MTRWACAFAIALMSACGPSSDEPGGTAGADAQNGDGGDDGDDINQPPACGALQATVRDFSAAHPDFETFAGTAAFVGIVETVLGADGKPVYAASGSTAQTTGPVEFAQWYHDVPGVNHTSSIEIPLTELSPGVFAFESDAFFPIDQTGFGDEGNGHNFHFTTEIHTQFKYKGGESFTFSGDDDLWLFINDRLVIDLGGLHPSLSAAVDFDARAAELGLVIGGVYPMSVFHAERHTPESNFRVETSIDCFTVP